MAYKGNRSQISRLLIGTAFTSLTLAAAQAQTNTATSETPETVTVTGTAIRGVLAPTGSNLIVLDEQAIEATGAQTTQELLTDIPQVSINFGAAGQAPEGNLGAGVGPTIHSLGTQQADATLVLIDGHRITPIGIGNPVVDPTIIPTSALQRVEVLPDGASSIYGADAIAGVINFITRSSFQGWETTSQYDVAADYNGFNFGQLFGTSWTGGNVMVAYNYSSLSSLSFGDRAYAGADQDIIQGANATTSQFPALAASPPAGSLTTTPGGVPIPYPSKGTDLQNFSCSPATIQANHTAPAFTYPYSGTGISVTQTAPPQGVCNSQAFQSLLPSQIRNSALVSMHQAITNSLDVSLELLYGTVIDNSITSRGSISATVFGPGGTGGPALGAGQINPFYVGNAATGTSSEYINYDFDQLLGPGAYQKDSEFNAVAIVGFNWDMGSDWNTAFDVDIGQSSSSLILSGQVCAPCALLDLNGTTNAAGTANTTPATSALINSYGLNTITSITQPLTTANALDVWDPPGPTNKTSQAVLNELGTSEEYERSILGLQDYYLKSDGPISWLDLGAGPAHVAAGAEYRITTMQKIEQEPSALGPAAEISTSNFQLAQQDNYSAFVEILVPLVKESEAIPLMKDLQFDISGRFDHFSDFGNTQNPKVGFAWTIFNGIKAHGSYSTAFEAPSVNDVAAQPAKIASGGIANGTVIPFASTLPYSTDTTFAGQGIAGTFVASAASCAAAGSNPVNIAGNTVAATSASAVACKINTSASPGLTLGGQAPLGPEKGLTYTAGVDIDGGQLFNLLNGLKLSATYYNVKMEGFITNSGIDALFPSLNALAPPGGWTASSPIVQTLLKGSSLTTTIPPAIYSIADDQTINADTLWQQGVDFSANYNYATENSGIFLFGLNGNQIIRFAQGSNEASALSIVDGDNNGLETGIEMTATGTVGWSLAPVFAQLMVQFAHPYSVINGNFPYNLAEPGLGAPAGYEHIGALWNVNLHLAYDLPRNFAGMGAWTTGTNVYLTVNNLLNTPPPYEDDVAGAAETATTSAFAGQGALEGNPIGREFMIGIRKDF